MRILIIFLLALLTGCGLVNGPHATAEKAYENIRNGNDEKSSVSILSKMCASKDYWNRYYGYAYMGRLFRYGPPEWNSEAINFLKGGLTDKSREIVQVSAEALTASSEEQINLVKEDLILLLESCINDVATCYAMEGLSKVQSQQDVDRVVAGLLKFSNVFPVSPQNNSTTAICVAETFGKIRTNDARVIILLEQYLGNLDQELAFYAADALLNKDKAHSEALKKMHDLSLEKNSMIAELAKIKLSKLNR